MNKIARKSGAIIAGITITASALTIGMDKIPVEPSADTVASVPSWTVVATTSQAGQASAIVDWNGYLYVLSQFRNYGELIFGNTVYLPSKAIELKSAANSVCAEMRRGNSSTDTMYNVYMETSNSKEESAAIVVASQAYVCPDMKDR